MAKATKVIHKMETDPEVRHECELRELEQLLTNHKEVLGDILSIADKMKDRELLDMMSSGLGQGDRIVHRIVTALDDSETPQSIKNALLLFQLLGTVNMTELEPLVLKINTGVSKAAEYEHGNEKAGYAGLIGALKDPEVVEGANVLLQILKGMGTQKDEEEHIKPQTERVRNPEREMDEQENDHAEGQKKPYGYALAAGAGALMMIPLILLRK
ncbi:DUF1641 domain-containing protein [Salinicoccus sediminis]|uniref:DUF1641 domain-containing protein n=1 Tax=Salinicoccus sediminis TaxID=1432562 RepID=UPI00069AF7C2|nr:DUF1641 domain-containing protein [Salinicoccus sediminis]